MVRIGSHVQVIRVTNMMIVLINSKNYMSLRKSTIHIIHSHHINTIIDEFKMFNGLDETITRFIRSQQMIAIMIDKYKNLPCPKMWVRAMNLPTSGPGRTIESLRSILCSPF